MGHPVYRQRAFIYFTNMRSVKFLVICLLQCYAANSIFLSAEASPPPPIEGDTKKQNANPLRSPNGALTVDINPLFADIVTNLSDCSTVQFKKEEVLQESMLWPMSGFIKFGNLVYKSFTNQSRTDSRILRFQDTLTSSESTGSNPLEFIASCGSRRMILDDSSLSSAICSCLSSRNAEDFCKLVDAYATTVHCHDQMAEQVDRAKLCPTLLTPFTGIQLSTSCSGWITGAAESLNLDLYRLNVEKRVPDVIDMKTALPEFRTYYLAYKAAETVTRWADAHAFCSKPQPGHPSLLDIEVLPSWKSQVYYFSSSNGKRIPLAVLARRDNDDEDSEGNFLLVIRDVRTTREGRLSITNRLGRRYFGNNSKGHVHAGYDLVASSLVSSMGYFLRNFFQQHPELQKARMTIVGHGHFGSGIASIAAWDVSQQFERIPKGQKIEYNLILFEGGPVGNFDFVTELRSRVNIRNIVSEYSAMANMPCTSSFGCGREFNIVTGKTGETIGPFIPMPGRIEAQMSVLGNVWSIAPIKVEIAANAVCAVPCWLSSNFCSDDPDSKCSYYNCGAFFTIEAFKTSLI